MLLIAARLVICGCVFAWLCLRNPAVSQIDEHYSWKAVQVAEAFPGSLQDLDLREAVVGGTSGIGSANKGNFAVNERGEMAITYLQGLGTKATLVIGRSTDGTNWDVQKIDEVTMRNFWGLGKKATITFVYSGPGPQCQIDATGNICVGYMDGSNFHTLFWPKDAAQLRLYGKILGDIPIASCNSLTFDETIGSFQLYCLDDKFYMVNEPGERAAKVFRVSRLNRNQWEQVGQELDGSKATLTIDNQKQVLYLGLSKFRLGAELSHPEVYRFSDNTWVELRKSVSGLRETFGITGYTGGDCPYLVATEGRLCAFWWQLSQLANSFWGEEYVIQGAEYRDGKWVSCGQSILPVNGPGPNGTAFAERDSFGQGHGLYRVKLRGERDQFELVPFYDKRTSELVVLFNSGTAGICIKDGVANRVKFHRNNKAESVFHTSAWDPVSLSNFFPHVSKSTIGLDGSVYVHKTMQKSGAPGHSDVFIFRLRPVRSMAHGATFLIQDASDPDWNWKCIVKSVKKDSPFDRAGLYPGDEYLGSFNNRPMVKPDDFLWIIESQLQNPGTSPLKVFVRRDGSVHEISVGLHGAGGK